SIDSILGCLNSQLHIKTITATTMPDCFAVDNNYCPNSNITFRLYNSEQRNGSFIKSDNLTDFEIDEANPLKVIIHGYNGSFESTPNLELLPQFLKIHNVNVIIVDYSKLAHDPCYTQSVHNAHLVGRCLGYLLVDILGNRPRMSEKLHLIGYGMGAHVASFAANYLTLFYIRVSHITALDPAKALYVTPDLLERLDSSDADFVDVIHTDVLIHGLMQPVGHVDFYPNKGFVQPNCGPIDDLVTHKCYHSRSAEYYAESMNISNVFWGFKCKDLYAFIVGECIPNDNMEQLGYYTSKSARGSYFLTTNQEPPYSMGKNFSNLDRTLYGKTFLGDDFLTKLKEMGS
ncbi:hypothetical protein KR044_002637, partial [Drosophila immigrans]